VSKSLYTVPHDVLSEFVFHSNWIEGYPPYDYPETSRLYRAHMKTAKHVVRTGDWDPLVLHLLLLDGTDMLPPEQVGVYRNAQVYIGSFLPPSPGRHLLAHVERWRQLVTDGPPDGADVEDWIWRTHYEYECVHPFIDGNGRTGRLIMNALRLRYDLPWETVHQGAEQQAYYGRIRDYQRSGGWRCSQWHPDKGYQSLFGEREAVLSEE